MVFMQRNVAYLLLVIMLGLITLGLVMLTSTSSVLATMDMTGVYSNLRKQCVWLVVGGIACVFLSRYDYQKLLRFAPWIAGLAGVLLVLCLIPHIGVRVNGSPRWLRVAGWTYQPSELAKLALIFLLSWWNGKKINVTAASSCAVFSGRSPAPFRCCCWSPSNRISARR